MAVRAPAGAGVDPGSPERVDSPEAPDQHGALVESLAGILDASPEQAEELLAQLHGELDGEGSPEDRALDAFERGLQLGLMVGLGSRELAVPSKPASD
jgi:hypothetical protein